MLVKLPQREVMSLVMYARGDIETTHTSVIRTSVRLTRAGPGRSLTTLKASDT